MHRLLILTFILISCTLVAADDQPWEFKIELSKEEYLLGENIWLDVTITNISEDTLKSAAIISTRGRGFTFMVRDSLEGAVSFTGGYRPAQYEPPVYLIPPGQQIFHCLNLAQEYRPLNGNPGTYTVQGVVVSPFESDCYFDNLESNKLSFRIMEPVGQEKVAHELYLKGRDQSQYGDSIRIFHETVLQQHPTSVYAEQIWELLLGIKYRHQGVPEARAFDHAEYSALIQRANEDMFRFPNSGNNFTLWWTLREMEKYDSVIVDDFLEKIIRAARQTRLARLAGQKLFERSCLPSPEPCHSNPDTTAKWELRISMSKEEYFQHEDVIVDVVFTNVSEDTLTSNCSFYPAHYGFDLVIKDSLGNQLEYHGMQMLMATSNRTNLIAPGEEVYNCFEISYMYPDMVKTPGQYTIYAQSNLDFYDPYRFPTLTSNEQSFRTVKLDGRELEVWQTWREAMHYAWNKKSFQSARKYLEICEEYPNSVFAQGSYHWAHVQVRNLLGGTTSEVINSYNLKMNADLINEYPDASDTHGWILGTVNDMGDDDKRDFLQKIVDEYPDTRAARFAAQELIREFRKQVPK